MIKTFVLAVSLVALASCDGGGDPARGATFLNLCQEARDTTDISNVNNCNKDNDSSVTTTPVQEPVS